MKPAPERTPWYATDTGANVIAWIIAMVVIVGSVTASILWIISHS